MPNQRDITGLRSGKLVAVRPHHADHTGWWWLAQCDCGNTAVVRIGKLRDQRTKSCGCGPRGFLPGNRLGARAMHQDNPWVGTTTYRSWAAMKSRCGANPGEKARAYYAAQNITVCDRWHSFHAFLADMGERPPGTTLDRYPDPYGNYEPGNCRWATVAQQASNRRKWGTIAAKKFPKP